MESSKHNDELIKRKLADLSVEPRKLKFAEVKTNFEKAKETSRNKWGLYSIIGGIGVAVLLSTYFILNSGSDQTLALNESSETQISQSTSSTKDNSATEATSSDQNTIHSVGTTNEDKFSERKNSETSVVETVKKESNTAKEVKETSSENSSSALKNNSNAIAKENSAAKEIKSEKNTSTGSVTQNVNNEEKKSTKKTTTIKPVDHTSSINNELAARTKNSENKPITKGKVRSTGITNTVPANKKEDLNVALSNKNSNEAKSNVNSSVNTKGSEIKEIAKNSNENTGNANSKTAIEVKNETKNTEAKKQDPIASNEEKQNGEKIKEDSGSNDQNKKNDVTKEDASTTLRQAQGDGSATEKDIVKNETDANTNAGSDQTLTTEGKVEAEITAVTKANQTSNKNEGVDSANAENHIPGVIGTGSVSPRNKHKFLIGAEASYSTLFFNTKENPNSPSQFSTGDPAFTTAYANAVGKGKHSLFNGAASLSYVYNEGVGISAGVSYFNLETKVDIQPFKTPQYTTAIDYFVWNWVADSSTLTLQIVDTIYKQVATGNYNTAKATVNGDSVSTLSFVNKVRYLSIPLNLSYNFKIGGKLSIEPQAGIIYTMPLKSSHLVATDAYKFEYTNRKTDLRSNLYFNAALKIGYNINNRTQLYIREGYFFRNQSIYNGDQPISLSLKSIYTSFGISFRIK